MKSKRTLRRLGISLPLVMGMILMVFALFLILNFAIERANHRLALQKHRAAAHWLAQSAVDLARARIAKGSLGVGERLSSPQLQNGRFEVESRREGGMLVLIGTGYSASEKAVLRQSVVSP